MFVPWQNWFHNLFSEGKDQFSVDFSLNVNTFLSKQMSLPLRKSICMNYALIYSKVAGDEVLEIFRESTFSTLMNFPMAFSAMDINPFVHTESQIYWMF